MKRIFYIGCYYRTWDLAVKTLKEEYDWEPVYWLDSGFEDCEKTIMDLYPNVVYHRQHNPAWNGVFPDIISSKANETYLDVDFLREYSSVELLALKMLDRQDSNRYSFNFQERQRHYRNVLKNWFASIDLLKPDIVISSYIPHRFFDYVLYWVCQYKHIPFIWLNHTQFTGRGMVMDDIFTIGKNRLKDDYIKYLHFSQEELYNQLPVDIRETFDKVKKDYEFAAPSYMESEEKRRKQYKGLYTIVRNFASRLLHQRKLLWKDPHIMALNNYKPWGVDRHYYCKDSAKVSLENSGHPSWWNMITTEWKNNRYKERLKNYYESLVEKPDYSEKFVLYCLHYQPEATSNPTGNIFVDQRLCVDMLLKNLPLDTKVYVKEHPHQFLPHREGHTSRIKEFYDDMKKNPRIKLISIYENTFNLMDHCLAIGTICGTVGWEAIVRKTPVILFGFHWYENFDKGVLRITDEKSAHSITSFINNYSYDEHALLAYLASVGKNTELSYGAGNNPQLKESFGLTFEISRDNIVKLLIDYLN